MNKNWFKLDNSAKIIPSITNDLNTNVFRLTCTLFEKIENDILQSALEEAVIEFPLFLYTMKNGMFWHYLEKSNIKPQVIEEKTVPCAKLDNGLLFRLSYYKNRIHLEVYHVLSDGHGAIEFLKYIVCTYLTKKYSIETETSINESSAFEKASDDFKKFDKSKFKIKTNKVKKAYKLKATKNENITHDVIEAHINLKELKEASKKYNTTITIYLAALLIQSIIENAKVKDLKKPVGLAIPVDLRNIFSSKTSRNFFYTVTVQYKPGTVNSIENIIESLKVQFDKILKKEYIQDLLDTFMTIEKFFFIRIIPNFIKDLFLGYISKIGKKGQTVALSNLGITKVPDVYKQYIESFTALMSTETMQLTVVSYDNDLVLGFTSHIASKEIERLMIKKIKEHVKSDIKIYSNMGDSND